MSFSVGWTGGTTAFWLGGDLRCDADAVKVVVWYGMVWTCCMLYSAWRSYAVGV